MKLKILKLLTVISFVLITFDTGHIGGQFGLFIILGLLSDYKDIIISALILSILLIFIISSFKRFKPKLDFYIFLFGGFSLLIPIIMHMYFLFSKIKTRIDATFYLTATLYLIIYGITLLNVFNKQKTVN